MTPLTRNMMENDLHWEWHDPYYVLKAETRIGWNPETKNLVVGYHDAPRPVDTAEDLLPFMEILGYESQIQALKSLICNQ